MTPLALSDESKQFLTDHIESVEDLEILLLLRSDPQHDWDVVEVSRHIGLEPIATSNRLMRLYLQGVVGHPQNAGRLFHYRHALRNKGMERAVAELAAIFAESRMEILTSFMNRQRAQLDGFAQAFEIGRAPKGG